VVFNEFDDFFQMLTAPINSLLIRGRQILMLPMQQARNEFGAALLQTRQRQHAFFSALATRRGGQRTPYKLNLQ
jgi:hypothetical protein